ncbi:MAG TPA: hypothetical protein VGO58_10420 [Chitinophagaceae bacterium]|jgi:hypothetical protein|nr:hypothetical protein [Chitinophagaceae bacterium]
MQFVKMIQFTRLVKAEGRLREFNFRKLRGLEEDLFSVNVCNERGDRILFNMQKKDNAWRIQSTELPKWIVQNEKALDEVIEDELKNPAGYGIY